MEKIVIKNSRQNGLLQIHPFKLPIPDPFGHFSTPSGKFVLFFRILPDIVIMNPGLRFDPLKVPDALTRYGS
jgi:hypothetical protein